MSAKIFDNPPDFILYSGCFFLYFRYNNIIVIIEMLMVGGNI